MILTCPNCATRYNADAANFAPPGRNVRCAKCGHVWHEVASASEPDPGIADVMAAPPAPPEQQPAFVPPPPEPVAQAAPEPADADAPPVEAPASGASAPRAEYARPAATESYREMRLPQTRAERAPSDWGRRAGVLLGWLLLLAVIIGIVWGALAYRQQIASVWPQSASVYASVGKPVRAETLDFRNVAYRQDDQGGQPVLAVSGEIVNGGSADAPVPPRIRVALSDDEGREIYSWTVSSGVASLKGGAAAPFSTRLASPPAGARHLEVRFDKDAP